MAEAGEEGDLTSGPLRKRVEDPRWKCRMLAFDELATALSNAQPEDRIYEEYGARLAGGMGFFLVSSFFFFFFCSQLPTQRRCGRRLCR